MAEKLEPGERNWKKDGVKTTQEYERSCCTLTTTSDSLPERVSPAASPRTHAQSHRSSPPAGTQMPLHQRHLILTPARGEHCEDPYDLELASLRVQGSMRLLRLQGGSQEHPHLGSLSQSHSRLGSGEMLPLMDLLRLCLIIKLSCPVQDASRLLCSSRYGPCCRLRGDMWVVQDAESRRSRPSRRRTRCTKEASNEGWQRYRLWTGESRVLSEPTTSTLVRCRKIARRVNLLRPMNNRRSCEAWPSL